MRHKKLVVLVKKSFRKVDAAFQKLSAQLVGGNIHLFRVEVKKLRALLRLISMGADMPESLKLPRSIKKIYRLGGLIRNQQLQHQHILKETRAANKRLPGEYLDILDKEAGAKIRRLKKLLKDRKSFSKQKGAIVDKLKGKLSDTAVEEFIRVKMAMLRILAQQPDPDEDSLHRIRKSLKDLQYNWPFIEEKASALLPPGLRSKDNLSSLTDLFGNFQDARVGLSLLQGAYLDKIQEEKERMELLEIKDKWQTNKEKTRQEIQAVLENILN
jgi:CHAD domain-containing protein